MDGKRARCISKRHCAPHRRCIAVVCADDIAIGKGNHSTAIFRQQAPEIGVVPIKILSQVRFLHCHFSTSLSIQGHNTPYRKHGYCIIFSPPAQLRRAGCAKFSAEDGRSVGKTPHLGERLQKRRARHEALTFGMSIFAARRAASINAPATSSVRIGADQRWTRFSAMSAESCR